MKRYFPKDIEKKWQDKWKESKIFTPDLDSAPQPYYSLMMFPYPSAEGLHVGNMYAFTGTDIFSRFKRMQGFDIFEPIGLDGFGIHSENYALKVNEHPMNLSQRTEKRFYEQLTMIGNSYAWDHTVETYKPNYYKWTQWLFLQMYKKGLAYRKKAEVNWCPSCKTVLADEQVISGECERCGSLVERRELEQWFFRITDYADRLLENIDDLDWSEKVTTAQRNWIGKSKGAMIKFGPLDVFTTRPDTVFGATFLVISPEHPLLDSLVTDDQKEEVSKYVTAAKNKSDLERKENKEKTGVFTGSSVKNPLTRQDIPVWVADYVLMGYGTGAIMAVPAHDERDFDFANKYNLPIIRVVTSDEDLPYVGEGLLIESGDFTGLESAQAREKITEYLTQNGLGKEKTQYHLRDWLISRQRYWGPPIPMVYCEVCGTVPVPEDQLPVELPYVENFRPTGTGQSPLATVDEFINTQCPKCGGAAKRETDVSDTFLDSAWYFLRYTSTEYNDKPFDQNRIKKWLPVNMYIGGAEHSVLHLLYSRFTTMVLNDLGLIHFEEPYKKFRAHGLIIKDGAKMSKSKGNIVNPDDYIKEYGADTLRSYLMFLGPFSDGGDFRDSGINGIYHFLQRVWGLFEKVKDESSLTDTDSRIMNKTIKKVGEDIEGLKYNTAIAAIMEWLNYLSRKEKLSRDEYKNLLLLLAPFAPHMTEELWSVLGEKYSIHHQSWPKFDPDKLHEEKVTIVVQVNGKVRDNLLIDRESTEDQKLVEDLALQSEKVKRFLDGKKLHKSIYVSGKILNLVAN